MSGSAAFAAFLAGSLLAVMIVLASIYSHLENFDFVTAQSRGMVHVAMVATNYAACLIAALLIRFGIRSRIALDGF